MKRKDFFGREVASNGDNLVNILCKMTGIKKILNYFIKGKNFI